MERFTFKKYKEQKDILNQASIAAGQTNAKGEVYTSAKPRYAEDRSTFQLGGSERRNKIGFGRFVEKDKIRQENIVSEVKPKMFIRFDEYHNRLYDVLTNEDLIF